MSVVELAKMLKERENKTPTGPVVGMIVSPPPSIQVSIGDKIMLDGSDLFIASKVLEGPLIKGDPVILIPSTDEQTYFLIDRAVRL